jgi:hypothetical protein
MTIILTVIYLAGQNNSYLPALPPQSLAMVEG